MYHRGKICIRLSTNTKKRVKGANGAENQKGKHPEEFCEQERLRRRLEVGSVLTTVEEGTILVHRRATERCGDARSLEKRETSKCVATRSMDNSEAEESLRIEPESLIP